MSTASQAVDVDRVPGRHEALYEHTLPRAQHRVAPACPLQADACALEGAGHRGDRVVERLGGLLRRPAEHVAQDQCGPLLRRQELDRGDECELDGLAGDEVFE
jgi:hypothetical protein